MASATIDPQSQASFRVKPEWQVLSSIMFFGLLVIALTVPILDGKFRFYQAIAMIGLVPSLGIFCIGPYTFEITVDDRRISRAFFNIFIVKRQVFSIDWSDIKEIKGWDVEIGFNLGSDHLEVVDAEGKGIRISSIIENHHKLVSIILENAPRDVLRS